MKKLKEIALITFSILAVVALMGLAEKQRMDLKFEDLKIHVDVSEGNYFVDALDIESLVFSKGYQLKKEPIKNIDLRWLETLFDAMPSVKKSEVYYSLNGNLFVDIEQRTPIARVFSKNGSFYLDEEGNIMPLSKRFTAKVPVVNGAIHVDYESIVGLNFAHLDKNQSKNKQLATISQVYKLAKKFKSVPLWDAQFKQIYVKKNGDFELVPAVGNHIVLIDGVANIDQSLTKLLILYKEGLEKTGWNNYKVINLKYKDQIVCIKR